MNFLFSLPGGSEWLVIIVFFSLFFVVMPVLTILMYLNNKALKKQVKELIAERKELLDGLLDDR